MSENNNLTVFEDEKQADRKSEDDNSIYLYFKDNPNLVIALLTFISTISVGIATFLLYLVQASYLSYFGVSDLFVNVADKTQLFNILVVVLALLLILFSTSYSSYRFSAYDQLMKADCYYIKICDDIIVNGKQFEDETDTIKKSKKLRFKIIKNIIRLFVRSFVHSISLVLVSSLLLGILFYSFDSYHAFSSSATFLLSIYASQLLVFVIKLIQYNIAVRKDNYKYEDPSLDYIENKYFDRKPLPEILTNKRLKSIFIYVLTYMVCVFILMSLMGGYTASHKTKYPIVLDQDKTYVEVYKSKDYVVLERAKTNDDSLIIFCDEQRVLGLEDYQFTVKTFNEVIKSEE